MRSNSQANQELWFKYYLHDTSNSGYTAVVHVRYDDNTPQDDRVQLLIYRHKMVLVQGKNGVYTELAANYSAGTSAQTWYDVYVKANGANVEVWRGTEPGNMTQVLSTTACTVLGTTHMPIWVSPDAPFRFDDFALLTASGEPIETVSYTYNTANELTQMVEPSGTTAFTYDSWGRTASKARGSYSAAYAYRYGDKLYSVASNFPGEGNVTYQYGGDQKRRERTAGGTTTKYRWDLGWNMINQENSGGALTMTYVMDAPLAEVARILADLAGTNPATGTARYYLHDNLGSTRRLRGSDKGSLGLYEYSPYGEVYAQSGVAPSDLGGAFTGKPWDAPAQLYYFPYRYYSPSACRWLTRDPLGMVDGPNVYEYVGGNPVLEVDPLGLDFADCMFDCVHGTCIACISFCSWLCGLEPHCLTVCTLGCCGVEAVICVGICLCLPNY